ncbi:MULTISPECIES: hypothetical protein [Oscillatoriales]|uniref:hypothetical protein n=1 Tax=Oscillatoriophycideae TaxID=1301283 RepID=UPI001683179F|nr:MULTISPECIES: hypothetical protein [Oscillatoriales]
MSNTKTRITAPLITGKVCLDNVIQPCWVQLTGLTRYTCLKLYERATNWHASVGFLS